jgi:hypothetical protein
MLALLVQIIGAIPIVDYGQAGVLPVRHSASMMLPALEFYNGKLKAEKGECKKHLYYLLHDKTMWEKTDLFSCISLRIFIPL